MINIRIKLEELKILKDNFEKEEVLRKKLEEENKSLDNLVSQNVATMKEKDLEKERLEKM